jgi:hypothetical protein
MGRFCMPCRLALAGTEEPRAQMDRLAAVVVEEHPPQAATAGCSAAAAADQLPGATAEPLVAAAPAAQAQAETGD